jgi:hypothetical protein
MDHPDAKPCDVKPAKPRALPSHVFLLEGWAGHPSGRVLAADADLIGTFDVEGVKYREATAFERCIGGFVN